MTGLLDYITRVDDLLEEFKRQSLQAYQTTSSQNQLIIDTLNKIESNVSSGISSGIGEKELSITYPSDGYTKELEIGVSTFDFYGGEAVLSTGVHDELSDALRENELSVCRSIVIYSDQPITVRLDNSGAYTTTSGTQFSRSNIEFKRVSITTTVGTNISIYASNSTKAMYSGDSADVADIWGVSNRITRAELATRVGSPMSFDKRGTLYVYDDFEDAPLKWIQSSGGIGGGVGQSVTLSNSYPYIGSGCMKLIPPDAVGDYVKAYRYFGGITKNRIGVEFNIRTYDTLNQKTQIVARINTGSNLLIAGIRLQQTTSGGISYLNATGSNPSIDASWTSFNTDFILSTNKPYPMKFVFDVNTEKYVRFMFGGTEIDMAQYTPYTTSSSDMQNVGVEAWVINGTVSNPATYFDNFILTNEEPA